MMLELRGNTALVTRPIGGIGEAFARAFAAEGCTMWCDPTQIERMMRDTESRFGRIDILVNNAVTRHYAPVEAFPVEKWDHALAVNLSAAFHTIRLALPGMKGCNWGRIINMGSIPMRHGWCAIASTTWRPRQQYSA